MENFVNLLDGSPPDMGKKWNPLIPYKFDKYLTPETLKLAVLNSTEIERICSYYSGGNAKRESELKEVVKCLLEEIGFKRNMTVIRFLGITLNKVLLQMADGVYVNKLSIANAKRMLSMSRCPVLYLPSHRSYADFVLMSYICFSHDLEIPAIAAGMDFHAMVGMGSMLRNTGAFFMRRSFSSDKMYWEVFREYIRTLVTHYHSGVEFFIEGTRSRSCKALSPKIGLFSMTLEPFITRAIFDVLVVPVGISYDRPVEEQLFAYELLGVPKPKESTKGLFKVFEIMESNHGRMFVNFGEPMSLYDYFDQDRSIFLSQHEPNKAILTKERLQLINRLSHKIVDDQQKLIVITPFNLIAIYFNYRSMINEKCNREQLRYGINLLNNFLKKFNALLSSEIATTSDSHITDSLEIHSNILAFPSHDQNSNLQLVFPKVTTSTNNVDPMKLKGHNLLPRTMRLSLPSILLQIYANPCLYWLHQPAFYVLVKRMSATNSIDLCAEMERAKQIFVNEFIVSKNVDIEETVRVLESMKIDENPDISNLLLSSIVPFVFCYFNVVDVIKNQLAAKPFTEKELYVKVQMHVENRLNANAPFVHPYCLSLDSIANALHSLVANNSIVKQSVTKQNVTATEFNVIADTFNRMSRDLQKYCSHLTHFNGLGNYLLQSKI